MVRYLVSNLKLLAMKYLFVLLASLLSINLLAQQTELSGLIKDAESLEPIPFVNVKIEASPDFVKGVRTDFSGRYHVKLDSGIYKISVAFVGYEPQVVEHRNLRKKRERLSFMLKPSVAVLESYEIVEYKRPLLRKAMSSMSVRTTIRGARSAASEGYSVDGVKTGGAAYKESAGQLTAGQIKDFQDWDLWLDINKGEMKAFQENWGLKALDRYSVIVQNEAGKPMSDVKVELLSKAEVIWTTRTDNFGQAELWESFLKSKESGNQILVHHKGKTYPVKRPSYFDEAINFVVIPGACDYSELVDLVFVVDATGSMGDEINFLKSELKDVIEKVEKENPELQVRLGSVFYRDKGDEYVVRKHELNADVKAGIKFIGEQAPGGGGDYPEAMDAGMEAAINELSWSENARARIMFVLADAPPHGQTEHVQKMQETIKAAARKGIRIVPVAASGVNKSLEYLFRSMALATNGSYTFLTDHSGIGNAHMAPTTSKYDVEKLNELMYRLVDEYTYVPSCDDQQANTLRDTLSFILPNILQSEILNDAWVVQYSDSQIVYYDTTSFIAYKDPKFKKPLEKKDSLSDKSHLLGITIYPNPCTSHFNYALDGHANKLMLLSLSGKLIKSLELSEGTRNGRIEVERLPSGLYLLIATNGTEKITAKIQVL